LGEVKKATVVTEVIRQLLKGGSEKAEINWAGEVDCRNNLSSEVLNEITCLLGLTFTKYETRSHFLDNSLLFNRNGIAHGELLPIDEDTFMAAHEAVVSLIEQFRTDIENAAVTERYRRTV
jgi:MAE_28990/MAE_18760-like HEPN